MRPFLDGEIISCVHQTLKDISPPSKLPRLLCPIISSVTFCISISSLLPAGKSNLAVAFRGRGLDEELANGEGLRPPALSKGTGLHEGPGGDPHGDG
ncbi:hypothetical protein HPP92_023874 [Vanilla planifolia]|uniref:Uncharacterized protein n=1 Tax=Vanilla planifolia TaxID=51239 RepID=A0A835UAL8_VANPL|nr:hypothetical protein HPP92_023874 [Vanilla planifolia]